MRQAGQLFIDRFLAVSCTSGSACIAAGYTSNGTLVEIWNGTDWVLDSSGNAETLAEQHS
jgi:hypothetical protein